MSTTLYNPCPVEEAQSIGGDYDAVVVVSHSLDALDGPLAPLKPAVEQHIALDASAAKGPSVMAAKGIVPSGRVIYSPTGSVTGDIDDVRRFSDAAGAGVKKATATGAKSVLLAVLPHIEHPNAQLVGVLGALQALYVSCEAKAHGIECSASKLGVFAVGSNSAGLVSVAKALEAGSTVMRDIFASDPVFMAPPAAAKYIAGMLDNSEHVRTEVIADLGRIAREYPAVEAVSRGCNDIERFQARVVKLEYVGEGETEETLMLVGKGVTFDTGGTDIKTNCVMQGMRADKGGAASIAGLFKILSILQPKGIKVVATLPLVRNAISNEAYTCDEIIKSRSGKRLRIINTDAEGRMIMLDPLTEMREKAVSEVKPHLFTIATLTGHAVLSAGNYPIAVDNGAARAVNSAEQLKECGENIGNPFAISYLRREDIESVQDHSQYADLLQSPAKPSSQTLRGHQIPMAFLIEGSLLSQHGRDSKKPIPYTHIDMAGVPFEPVPHASPVLALAARYVLPRMSKLLR